MKTPPRNESAENRTFRTEGWLVPLIIGTPLMLGLAVALGWPLIQRFVVSQCVESGGKYDHDKEACIRPVGKESK